MQDNFNKTREEQLKDFQEVISPYADKKCSLCFGRGYQGWSDEHQRFVACACVIKNVENEVAKGHTAEAEKGHGVINKFRQIFTLN